MSDTSRDQPEILSAKQTVHRFRKVDPKAGETFRSEEVHWLLPSDDEAVSVTKEIFLTDDGKGIVPGNTQIFDCPACGRVVDQAGAFQCRRCHRWQCRVGHLAATIDAGSRVVRKSTEETTTEFEQAVVHSFCEHCWWRYEVPLRIFQTVGQALMAVLGVFLKPFASSGIGE